jgi:hypothetical protein
MLRALLLPVTAAAVLALPAASLAVAPTIVPGSSLMGFSLDGTLADITSRLGAPTDVLGCAEGPCFTAFWTPRRLQADFDDAGPGETPAPGARITALASISTKARTKEGVGPGVTFGTLRKGLRGERCDTWPYSPGGPSLACTVGRGARLTLFISGAVTRKTDRTKVVTVCMTDAGGCFGPTE